jgi:clan AA aspartic protease (TIGR02281 family)
MFAMGRYQSGRLLHAGFGLVLGVALGLVLGYQHWARPVPVMITPREVSQPAPVVQIAEQPPLRTGGFSTLESEIVSLIAERNFSRAIERLVDLDLLATTPAELAQVSALLEEAVKLRVVQLQSRERLGDIDALYENLTYAMPERAEYFLLLAEHRIRMGARDAALPVLAQIENHAQLGSRARELMAQLTAESAPVLAEIEMTRRGGQFVIDVAVDGRRNAALLLDTGASMTVLKPAFLASLGYEPGDRRARFSTAGGVVRAPVVNVKSLAVAGIQVDALDIGVLSLAGDDVDGLLGMDYLSRFEFDIDQENSVLRLVSAR